MYRDFMYQFSSKSYHEQNCLSFNGGARGKKSIITLVFYQLLLYQNHIMNKKSYLLTRGQGAPHLHKKNQLLLWFFINYYFIKIIS